MATTQAGEPSSRWRLDGVLSGVFALVGVLIGGFITFEITWWQDRDTRIADERQATRLVATEIRKDTNALFFVYEHGYVGKAGPPSTVYWDNEGPTLARDSSSTAWGAISAFYIQLLKVSPSLSTGCVGPATDTRIYAKQGGNNGNIALVAMKEKPVAVPPNAHACP